MSALENLPGVSWVRAWLARATQEEWIFPLSVLFFLYFFDEFDTAAFGVLAPELKKAFDLSDNGFVTLVILNVSVVLLLAIPVGFYGDRLPRTKLVFGGALLAGIFSFGTGIAWALPLLVVARLGNGIGLLVNDPIHRSLLSDYYTPKARPTVYARHANAQRWAAVIGPIVAGTVAVIAGWRAAFMILIVPIILMAIVSLRLKNPVRGITDDEDSAMLASMERGLTLGRGGRILFSVRTLRRQYISWLFIGAGFIPLAAYIPLYFDRVFGFSPFQRGVVGAVVAIAGLVGVQLAGKWTAGWLAKGMGTPLRMAGLSLAGVGPLLALFGAAPTWWLAMVFAIAATFVGAIFTPPFLTTQALVSPARVRSLSFGFGSVFIVAGVWLLFLIPGVGKVADHDGMRWAMVALAPYWVIGGLVLRSGGRYVDGDVRRALEVLQTTAELRRQRENANERSILVIRDLDVSYGQVQVLFGVDFEMQEGEIVALLGTNGAGKSTLLRAISGLVPPTRGAIFFDGEDVTGLEPEDSFACGLVQVPGGRGIFPGLTVAENLEVAAWASRQPKDEAKAAIAEACETFPALKRRWDQPAAVLSGGEQQMLTLAQAFIAKPKLLMIDELSLGLAPIVVEDLLRIVRRIHESGTAIILVEQSVNVALTVADRAVFMEKGEVRFSGRTADLLEREDILRAVFLTGSTALEGAK